MPQKINFLHLMDTFNNQEKRERKEKDSTKLTNLHVQSTLNKLPISNRDTVTRIGGGARIYLIGRTHSPKPSVRSLNCALFLPVICVYIICSARFGPCNAHTDPLVSHESLCSYPPSSNMLR